MSQQSPKLSFAAIVVIAANTMNGPGLTTLPEIASAAGQVTFQILVGVAALVTSFVVARLCSVMWTAHAEPQPDLENGEELGDLIIPTTTTEETTTTNCETSIPAAADAMIMLENNKRPRLEETDIVALSARLFGPNKIASIAMVGCALSLALAQMMLCAAIADAMVVAFFGRSCGIGAVPLDIYCTSNVSMKPFLELAQDDNDDDSVPVSVYSIGIAIASTITISLAAVDLDSMLSAQYFLFGCLLVSCARFCSTLSRMEDPTASSILSDGAPFWIGARPFDAVGPTLFNFAFVVTAPPLICGTDSADAGTRALVVACLLMGCLYMIVGTVGANAAANTAPGLDINLLSLVLRGTDPSTLAGMDIVAVVLFGLSQLAAIPVYCELARETLLTHFQIKNRALAFAASHMWPWVLVAMTYNSPLFEAFVEWSSLLLLGFANFSIPLLLDHVYTQRLMTHSKLHEREGDCPSSVVWGLALITASISAVIVERITGSLLWAEIIFMGCTVAVFHWS